jgi:single-strand DNA-binding protein
MVGNVGSDPQVRTTPKGKEVASFSVAVSRKYKGADGQQKEETLWFRVSAWEKLSGIVSLYVKKGDKILVEGELVGGEDGSPRVYTGKDGNPHASFEVRAETIKLLGGKPKESEESAQDI